LTFNEWIRIQIVTDDPQGDLVKDIRGDRRFPKIRDYEQLRWYLVLRDACDECMDVAEEAWERYQSALTPQNTVSGKTVRTVRTVCSRGR